MSLRTILFWAAVAIVVYAMYKNPTSVTHLVHQAGGVISHAADSLSQLAASL